MARSKPLYRRLITTRMLRYQAMHMLATLLPQLARKFNFYTRVIDPETVAGEVLVRKQIRDTAVFSDYEKDYLSRYCKMDRVFADNDNSGTTTIDLTILRIPNCEVHGHTGALIKTDRAAILARREKTGDVMGIPLWNISKPRILRDQGLVRGACVSMIGFGRGNRHYYHFLIDSFLPLCVYLLDYHPSGEPLTILIRQELAAFQRNAFALLRQRYPFIVYREIGSSEKIAVENLMTIRYMATNRYRTFSNDAAIALMRDLFFAGYDIDPQACRPTELLYIGRREVKRRNIVNEDEIMAALGPLGFRKIEPGGMPHAEQVKLFANARLIVAAHGTALTNVLFCVPGAAVIEISPANYVQSVFFWMVKKMRLGYDYLIGGHGDLQQNFRVDVPTLKRKVEALLSARPG